LAWESEQIYFVNRHKFDLIVYYDQSSTNISLSLNEPLRNLKAAIYENEFSKMLQRVPVMLVGGFDAWVKQIGQKGVHVFPPTTKQPQLSQPPPSKDQENIPPRHHEKQLWLKNVVGKTEDVYGNGDSINRSVMDYVRTTHVIKSNVCDFHSYGHFFFPSSV
jgi:ubiquitin carboxyl-terminal hydrolase 8